MARPKKKPSEKRDGTLHIKTTKAERAEMDKAARVIGEDTSAWVRRTILELIRKSSV